MKKYPTLNNYFNKTPKIWLMILIVFYAVGTIFVILSDFSLGNILKGIIQGGVALAVLYVLYMLQDGYVYARAGRHLKKYYGLDNAALESTFRTIENEADRPLYKDTADTQKYLSFFVTENWLVGTDGVMLLRMNVCKRADIVSIDKKSLSNGKQTFYILEVKDKNNYTYQFALRSPQNVEQAFDFLKSTQEAI